jgi:hypothetical protein
MRARVKFVSLRTNSQSIRRRGGHTDFVRISTLASTAIPCDMRGFAFESRLVARRSSLDALA